ncbi:MULTISPECIES: proteasome assembly chaperone family protein [Halococcus]|uniref:Proteasome assembly chaperone family protein n=1 Tax=Halococcus salifodinae DSM 8989 TaxID=1227456 RepID=M0MUP0_9EURY|nr:MULTISPECIES: PAC2 family protein [Halococcus]EMA49351.1 hypothetical protein C450_17587 [Halococcus salifodinae DSM 8989]
MAETTRTSPDATFDVVHDAEPPETLLAGFAEFGMAGLTAADSLVDQLDLEQTGHITADRLPAITPFSDGVARHHTRLFSRPDLDLTVLVGELFVPLPAAAALAESVLEWTEANGVTETTVLSGVPMAHGPDEHRSFYVATEAYRERRLDGVDAQPMGNGFLDGINGTLMARGIDSSLDACVLTTPVHPLAPDAEAAARLLETADAIYDLGVDAGPLRSFAEEVRQHYESLAEHVESTEDHRYDDQMFR